MKVTFLHSSNDVYGASRVLEGDVIRLANEGHEVSVVVPADGPLVALQRTIGGGYVVDRNLAVIRRVNPRDAARLPRLPIRARKADVVVLWTLPLALYAPMLRARHRAHVVSVHERDDSRVGSALLTLAVGRRTPTQVNSQWVGEWVGRRVVADRIARSYPSITWATEPALAVVKDKDSRAGFSRERPMSLLLSGRISGSKGHMLAVRVVEELAQRSRHVHLTLAGAPYPGQERHLNDLLTLTSRLQHLVSFVGEVESMKSVAGGKDLLLMLPTRPEPFGLTPLEAWQCGLPVLGIPTGGAAESLALVGGMITKSDFLTIADDLTRLYDDPHGAWRNPPITVPGQILCTEQDRSFQWKHLLQMAVESAQ
jgi:glycosyltransferase involved in cell wall biosynthesis